MPTVGLAPCRQDYGEGRRRVSLVAGPLVAGWIGAPHPVVWSGGTTRG